MIQLGEFGTQMVAEQFIDSCEFECLLVRSPSGAWLVYARANEGQEDVPPGAQGPGSGGRGPTPSPFF